jgi:hypothetical protein
MQRRVLDGNTVRYADPRASFTVVRLRPGLVLMFGDGHDTGQFGDAPLADFDAEIARFAPIELFCDASELFNASQVVFERWASWMQSRRSNLKAINVLTASKFVHLTISIAKVISGTGELMRLYTDPRSFEEAIAREVGRTFSLAEARARIVHALSSDPATGVTS